MLALKDCLTASELKLKKQLVRHLYHDMLMFHHREYGNLPRRIKEIMQPIEIGQVYLI